MELLEGETLTKVIERERQLSVERAVDILTQIGEALMEAHALGYVHRDLRPRNVFLINKRGRADFVKLLDFGLAKLILPDAEAKQTAIGMTFGDPRYMSPEQARGEPLDRRSDIYSLGAIAFEMLTGSPPYTGSGTFEILQQHLDAPVPKVRERRADCPAWLDAAVQRALAKKPDGRFATVAKLLESLRAEAAPAMADAAEKAEHARLSSERPPAKGAPPTTTPVATPPPPATTPPPVQSMGPVVAQPPPPVQSMGPVVAQPPPPVQSMGPVVAQPPPPARAPSARETQALTTLAPRPKSPEAKKPPAPSAAASGSVEVTPSKMPDAANVPSVVVEGSSNEKTAPAVPAKLSSSEAPPPMPSAEPQKRKADPTGEWFSSDSQPVPIVKGAAYDDLDEIPHTNRGPLIIGGVAGGLILVGVIVIALLPKAEHKPLRGESVEPAKAAAQAEPLKPTGATAQPTGATAQPTGATAQPTGAIAQPTGAAAQPTGVAAAAPAAPAAPATGAPAKPSPVPVAPAPPSAVAVKPVAQPAPAVVAKVPPVEKPVTRAPPIEKPAAKAPPAQVEKAKPAPERPTRVAAAERPVAAARRESTGRRRPRASRIRLPPTHPRQRHPAPANRRRPSSSSSSAARS